MANRGKVSHGLQIHSRTTEGAQVQVEGLVGEQEVRRSGSGGLRGEHRYGEDACVLAVGERGKGEGEGLVLGGQGKQVGGGTEVRYVSRGFQLLRSS